MREAIREPVTRTLDDEPRVHRLVDRVEEGAFLEHVRVADRRELEVGAGDGRELEELDRRGREPLEALVRDLADGRRRPQLGRGPDEAHPRQADGHGAFVHELAPELRDEERVAAGELADGLRQLRRRLGTRRQPDELGELAVGEPPEPDPNDTLRSIDVDERLRELGGDVRLGVAKGRNDQHPCRGARADEVPDEEQRRRVGPVQVLEHEQDGRLGRDTDEELGHRGVEAQPLGVRVGGRPSPRAGGTRAELRDEPCEVDRRGAEGVENGRRDAARPDQLGEGGRERRVGRADDGVAVPIEHRRPFLGELGGELPDEPALPGAGLAGDERCATALTDCPRQQRAQLGELTGPAGECVRRQEPKRAREMSHLGHDQF